MTSDPNTPAGATPPATDPSQVVDSTATAAGATPAASDPPATTTTPPAGATPPDDGKDELIAKLRANEKANEARLKRLADLEAAEAERVEAAKTEQQRLEDRAAAAERERDEAKAEAQRLVTERAFESRARELGMTARLAPALAAVGPLTLAEDGSIADLDAKLEALKASDPYLFTPAAPTGTPTPNVNPGAGNQHSTTVTLTQEQRDIAHRAGITEEQYAAQLNT